MKALVIGSGLAGLAAAYRLQSLGWEAIVLEADGEVGGRVKQMEAQGYVIPTGATQVTSGYGDYIALCKELGISGELIDGSNTVALMRNGRLYEIDGSKPWTAALSGALTLGSKLKMLNAIRDLLSLDPPMNVLDVSADHAYDDGRTALDYCLRRLNREIFDVVADPILRAYTLSRGENASVLEWFSAIRALGGVKFVTLRGGVQRLPKELAKRLDVRLNSQVRQVARQGGAIVVDYASDGQGQHITADACVIATRLPEAVKVCPEIAEAVSPLAERLTYNRGYLAHLGYRVRPRTRATGVLVPGVEDPHIALLWLEHNKGEEGITPEGHALMTAYFDESSLDRVEPGTDEAYCDIAAAFVEKIYPELKGQRDFAGLSRWPLAIPQPSPGHYRAVDAMKKNLDPKSPIQLAGDYFTCTGQNSAVHWGLEAAVKLQTHVARRNYA